MVRSTSVNFSTPSFSKATVDADQFDANDVQQLAEAVDLHTHATGKGLAVALADSTVTNAKLAADTARASLLTNGGFEIWQRGNGPFTGSGWTADRWLMVLSGTDTLSVQKTTVVDSGFSSALCSFSKASGTNTAIYQKVEDFASLRGKTVSVSVRVNTATANAVRIWVYDGGGGARQYGGYHPGGSTWATLSLSLPIPAGSADVQVGFEFNASCTAYIDNAMLVVGSVAADYAPLHPADDLARCLRYYEVIGNGVSDGWIMGGGIATAASQAIWLDVPFKARKAVQPTITKIGTWVVGNCAQPTVWNSSQSDTVMLTTSVAAGPANFYTDVAGKGLTIEGNP
jgi:hypothetical protein